MKKNCYISSIKINDESSWKKKLFLTFDMDWACDEILNDSIELVELAGISATWFVTHNTQVLRRLSMNPNFELGIHPNFNHLLNGDNRNGKNAKEVISQLMEIVPKAKSVRSHSTTQSSKLLELFIEAGITHDVNYFVPAHSGIRLSPWLSWNGLCRVSYYWADDAACIYDLKSTMTELTSLRGLKVFGFHPIHVYLNTENLDRYERTRHLHNNPEELIKHRYEGVGTRTRLIELLKLAGSPITTKLAHVPSTLLTLHN